MLRARAAAVVVASSMVILMAVRKPRSRVFRSEASRSMFMRTRLSAGSTLCALEGAGSRRFRDLVGAAVTGLLRLLVSAGGAVAW